MIGIYINGEFLDLLPDTKITIQKENKIYATGDPSLMTDPYTFPLEVPLTEKNNRLLDYPSQIAAFSKLLQEEPVVIYAGEGKSVGLPLFSGTLYVKKATDKTASVFIIVETISRFKDTRFEDVDLGTHEEASGAAMRATAKATTTAPGSYDFVFFPYTNRNWLPGNVNIKGDPTSFNIVNYWNFVTEHFVDDLDELSGYYAFITPFMRVDFLFTKLAEHMGYTIDNQLQEGNDELEKLYLYNNHCILQKGRWPDTIVYNQHVPSKVLILEFIKEIASIFCCGIFPNPVTKKLSIIPLKNVLNQPHAQDWSLKAERSYSNEQDNTIPEYFTFQNYAGNEYYKVYNEGTWTEHTTLAYPATSGIYRYIADNSYRYVTVISPGVALTKTLTRAFSRMYISGGTGDPKIFQAAPMYQVGVFPALDQPLTGYFITTNEEDEDDEQEVHAEFNDIRLTLYRGMVNTGGLFGTQPIANFTAYDIASSGIGYNHSLDFAGDEGLYEKFWKQWLSFMENKKTVTRSFRLTIPDILNLEEYHKVRVDGMIYFVKSMKITIGPDGLDPVECELYSIPFS